MKRFFGNVVLAAIAAAAIGFFAFNLGNKGTSAPTKEEHGHAMKFYQYMQEQGAAVEFQAIEAPPAKFGTMQKLFTEVLAHEQFITRSIHGLMDLAVKESDYATQGMLQWFVKEQVEEEASASEVLARIKMAGNEPRGLLIIDREMARRQAG